MLFASGLGAQKPQPEPVEPKYWQWELVDGNWELVKIDSPERGPPEQMRLPFLARERS